MGASVLCFVGINAAMRPVSRSQYCGSRCHEMNTAYQSWKDSSHRANRNGICVECIDCHLPPEDDYFAHVAVKAYCGARGIYEHHFGSEYDVEKTRKEVLDSIGNQRCTNCHNDLLAKPGSTAARVVHAAILNQPDAPDSRCVKCHEDVGHKRQNKLPSP